MTFCWEQAQNVVALGKLLGHARAMKRAPPRILESAPEVIDALGGNRAVASWLRVLPETVSAWRKRGFPVAVMPIVRARCKSNRVRFNERLFEPRPHGNRRSADYG